MKARKLLSRLYGRASMRLGRIGRQRPLSADFGYSRGTPVDRYYIEHFLAQHSADIRGHVLEVGDAAYSRRFGGERISKQDVLHVDESADDVTIVGDLSRPGVLPEATFDCIILTQTLHLIFDVAAAVGQLRRSLRAGGVLLVTVPGVSSVDRGEWGGRWYWSMTEDALTRLLCTEFAEPQITTATYGNLFAATAFLHGAAVEETGAARLCPSDQAYPVIAAARARATSA
jgi:SAM-dependent methyltransferase